jgi:hypothetical protein
MQGEVISDGLKAGWKWVEMEKDERCEMRSHVGGTSARELPKLARDIYPFSPFTFIFPTEDRLK